MSVGFKKTNADLKKMMRSVEVVGEFIFFRIRIPGESQINAVPNPEHGSFNEFTPFSSNSLPISTQKCVFYNFIFRCITNVAAGQHCAVSATV
jgi:hypothetical protein